MKRTKIILASASPRRRELLAQIGLDFEVRVSNVEEKAAAVEPGAMVEELSGQKAEAVLAEIQNRIGGREGQIDGEEFRIDGRKNETRSEECRENDEEAIPYRDVLIIGADTVVSIDGRILGKPADEKEAAGMLEELSGRRHEVYTGVTLLRAVWEAGIWKVRRRTFHEAAKVTFYPMSKEEISFYVSSGDCMDKAGAYGIQGLCARYIKGIEGDYNSVVGLPAGRLYQEIKDWMET